MTFSLGFSPCPNDTFIFDALVNKKIDTEGLSFDVVLEDVETLNQWALEGRLDITKLSFPAFFQSLDKYVLLNSGSALGKGVGPLLIKNEKLKIKNVTDHTVVLPGQNTTANLLFSFAYPEAKNKIFMRFDKIEDFVIEESFKIPPLGGGGALGVIIHENRFTYHQKGLHKVLDLGEYWEEKMNAPIPLGGIAIKKNIDTPTQEKVDTLIRKSLEYAFENYPFVTDYVKQHSQTMSEEVMRQHIDLYVNNYSLDLGKDGKKAIQVLFDTWSALNSSAKLNQTESKLFLS